MIYYLILLSFLSIFGDLGWTTVLAASTSNYTAPGVTTNQPKVINKRQTRMSVQEYNNNIRN